MRFKTWSRSATNEKKCGVGGERCVWSSCVCVECVRACVQWLVYAIWEKGGMLCMSLHQVQVRANVQQHDHDDDGADLNAASAAATVSGARGGSEILFRRDKKRVSLTRLAKNAG